ncbi:MAG TPA: hypothetical protein VFO85_00515 [Vicinamibacteria bacterium]|nr:hypothetical protein [Vicinamibacteria bacterium]
MRVHQEEYEHPTQASLVRLAVFEQKPASNEGVPGLMPRESGFLLTEERLGSSKVVATLGAFDSREAALAAAGSRAEALRRQRYQAAEPAA